MPSRDQMWGPMSLEEYAEKLGEDLSRRPMPLTGLEGLPDMGALRTARKGDSISSILGSSDPAAIGAFMDVNGMKDSRLRVGESYLIPRRADLADQSMAGRGQAALNADNARAVERARRTILPGDAVTVRPDAAVFDPQKGILATRVNNPQVTESLRVSGPPKAWLQRTAEDINSANTAMGAYNDISSAVLAGSIAAERDGAARLAGKRFFKGVRKPFEVVDRILTPAEEVILAAENIRSGIPAHAAIPAAAIRTRIRLAAAGRGAQAGASLALRLPLPPQFKVPAVLLGGIIGGAGGAFLGDELPSSAQISQMLR